MKKYDVIAFDLDGTLSDPAAGLIQGFEKLFHNIQQNRNSTKVSKFTFVELRWSSEKPVWGIFTPLCRLEEGCSHKLYTIVEVAVVAECVVDSLLQ